jgi:myo-inositol-1(or 4)-monophosphatase
MALKNNYSECYQILSSVLKESGKIIMRYKSVDLEVSEKQKNEIVTPADIASNNYIIKELLKTKIPIYSEEGDEFKSEDSTRWIVDPLDGTTPWVWGNSGFSISIALEKDNEIVLGAVYDPVMDEFFYAEKGKGSSKNGIRITTSKNIDKKDMFMVVDWGNKDDKRKEGLNYFKKFFVPKMFCKRIVPQFAPALGICHIAEGRTHALVCNDTWVEDHAAASLILKEAGGYCSNFYSKNNFDHRESGIIAVNEISTHKIITDFLS